MFDYSLFTELHFILLSLSTITLFTWFIVPYFYLADMMVKTGIYTEAQASFTIGNIGLSNTIGMVSSLLNYLARFVINNGVSIMFLDHLGMGR